MRPTLTIAIMAAALAGGAVPSLPQDFFAEPAAVDSLAAPSFAPIACRNAPFTDVSPDDLYCPWIQQLAADGITAGCGGGKYCPQDPVTRAQLAMLLERAMRGTDKFTHAASLFGTFGGNGQDGARTIFGFEPVGAVRRQYTELTVPVSQTLYVDHVFAYIAVQGRCTIAGNIDAAGRGAAGSQGPAPGSPADDGSNGVGDIDTSLRVPDCAAGAGGGGGSVSVIVPGGAGGGASSGGTRPVTNLEVCDPPSQPLPDWFASLSGGSLGVGGGDTTSEGFFSLLRCAGAGGGSGGPGNGSAVGASGGRGGGVLYLECGELDFPAGAVLDSRGNPGVASDGVSGAGGGGGGGVILVRTRKIVSNAGLVSVLGAAGGTGTWPGCSGATGYRDIVVVP